MEGDRRNIDYPPSRVAVITLTLTQSGDIIFQSVDNIRKERFFDILKEYSLKWSPTARKTSQTLIIVLIKVTAND